MKNNRFKSPIFLVSSMKIEFLKNEKNKIELKIIGEDHTLCNILRRELWNDNDVDVAAYTIDHPLVSDPIMLVETKKSDPKKALLNAADSLKKQIEELKKSFSSAI